MSRQQYFQINTAAHPEKTTLDNAWEKTSHTDQAAIKQMEAKLPTIVRNELGAGLTGLGHIGFMELLCKLALWEKSVQGNHTEKGTLARMDVVIEALERDDG